MDSIATSRLLSPKQVEERLADSHVLVVDLGDAVTYRQNHVPKAAHLEYSRVVRNEPPVMGLVPNEIEFTKTIRALGIDESTHVIAYDDEGGGKASRFLWTLELAGHTRFSLMDGGLHSWFGERLSFDKTVPTIRNSDYQLTFKNTDVSADRDYILSQLGKPDVVLFDARTPEEYNAIVKRALRGGHIPGAVNYDWMNALDLTRHKQMKPAIELLEQLAKLGVTPDKEIITYCHSHHRSAYSYQMLKTLGFNRVRGYPGSWSDWGNHPATPVEQ